MWKGLEGSFTLGAVPSARGAGSGVKVPLSWLRWLIVYEQPPGLPTRRLITRYNSVRYISEATVHMLPVTSRIKYKIAIITYKSLSIVQSTYLNRLLHHYKPSRRLCSDNENLLALPTSSEFGGYALNYFVPLSRNNLSLPIRFLHSLKPL